MGTFARTMSSNSKNPEVGTSHHYSLSELSKAGQQHSSGPQMIAWHDVAAMAICTAAFKETLDKAGSVRKQELWAISTHDLKPYSVQHLIPEESQVLMWDVLANTSLFTPPRLGSPGSRLPHQSLLS